ncbi:hypothetical protein M5K25_009766 [Dendrobium thyrsiflorum]|uniref:Phosphoglycerate mutase n=1 Tax=Dendrobium thyrsiflorum TaxID=117978 RepID=A0ABD0V6E8_DENTH
MGESLSFLRNSYWILRHDKSIPNENGLIVSTMANGTLEEFGLAPEGIHQAKLAGELLDKELKARNVPIEIVQICYSPFSRTTHTAKIVADYAEIWVLDEKVPFTSVEGGESVADVCSRISIALTALETAYQGCNIIFVSHGDPLQIFQTILHAVKDKTSAEVDISSIIK